jgi:hypothetical protein
MNRRPYDEFDGIFDNLTLQDFTPVSTVTFPAESTTHFDEFVDARLEAVRPAYAPGKSLSHAVLSNDSEVRQLAPDDDEVMAQYLQRLTRNARNMHAHSFFFCRIVDATSLDLGFCVLWIAHHVAVGEQILRSGLIPIKNGELGEVDEAAISGEFISPMGVAFTQVLMP